MTVIVTRNAPDRVRGFMASCACEIAPGIYSASRMNRRVREQVWSVITGWLQGTPDSSIAMIWHDATQRTGQSVQVFGTTRIELVDLDGIHLARRDLPAGEHDPP